MLVAIISGVTLLLIITSTVLLNKAIRQNIKSISNLILANESNTKSINELHARLKRLEGP